ncbi:MAG: riboflavin synthase [Bacteroidota bacterium]
MFTGIVEEIGIVKAVQHGAGSSRVTIGAKTVLEGVKVGDSINTNGVCLTVTSFGAGYFTIDVMPETMRRTNFGSLKAGSRVNLERALRLMDRLGGHLVSGHIDDTGKIGRRWVEDNAVWFSIHVEGKLLRYIVEKGSVAIDGISLTVAAVDRQSFTVSVIPHTQEVTTLPDKKAGDLLNIECDMIAKYIEKLTSSGDQGSKIDMDFLAKNNFL